MKYSRIPRERDENRRTLAIHIQGNAYKGCSIYLKRTHEIRNIEILELPFNDKYLSEINHGEKEKKTNEGKGKINESKNLAKYLIIIFEIDCEYKLRILIETILMQKGIEKSKIIIIDDILNKNKLVYICGLDGDFKRKKFGDLLDLIPICDKVYKLRSLCAICKNGTRAIFSKRLIDNDSQKVIGSDIYVPVCRKCYQDTSKTFIGCVIDWFT